MNGRVWLLLLGLLLAACGDDGHSGRALKPVCTHKTCWLKERALPAVRGKIVDRKGVPLADNAPVHDIVVTPRTFDDRDRDQLIRLLGLAPDEVTQLDARLKRGRRRASGSQVSVLTDQSVDRVKRVEDAAVALPGVAVRLAPGRVYPQGALAAHVVGYMTSLPDSEVDRLAARGYDPDDRVGRFGVESAWEDFLRGTSGRELEVRDRQGQLVIDPAALRDLTDAPARVEAIHGDTVVLTLDSELQRIAEEAIAPHGAGAVVVVEVATGKLLAMVSEPSFEPQVMSGNLTRAQAAALNADPRKPFVDKTTRDAPAPGSLFSFVTAVAALEDGLTTPAARISCTGSHEVDRTSFRCTARHGALDLGGALQRTCNVHIWKLAERVGIDRIAEVAGHFGFGARSGLGLNGDSPGRVPTRAWYDQRDAFRIGRTLNDAIGQGEVVVTLTQLAMAYAALASGTRHVPQIVDHLESADGHVKLAFDAKLASGWSAPGDEILALIRRSMWQGVNERGGSAALAHSTIVEIAGQAATAEVRARVRPPSEPPLAGWDPARSHAWFAGWAPAAAPEVAIVVLVEHGGRGADVAAPVARQILEGWWTQVR